MVQLFHSPLYPGVKVMEKDPKQIAAENPSLLLGFLPVIGGAITTPMQLSEIHRATVYQSAAQHFLKLIGIKSFKMQGQNVQFNLHETPSLTPHVSFREPHTVTEFLQKRALAQKAVVKYLQAHARVGNFSTVRAKAIVEHRQKEAHRAIMKFYQVNNRLKVLPVQSRNSRNDSVLPVKPTESPSRGLPQLRRRPINQA